MIGGMKYGSKRWSYWRVAGLGLLLILVLPTTSAGQGDRPNFVIILTDDLGYGDLGNYGNPTFRTPHLDQMASQGVRFTDFYAPVPFCAPSRASLLTGHYPHHHRVLMNPFPALGIDDVGIPSSEVTLGEALQDAGYRTMHIGKWHLGHKPEFYPTRNGFDEYYGILYSNDMRPVQVIDGEEIVEYPVLQATLTQRYTNRSLEFIERNQDRPFFLYLAHAMPHKPLAASEEFYKKTETGLYGDVIAELDWSVGKILGKLKELNLDEKTLVIFTSDNGPWYGGSTGGLRGMKPQAWEGGIRVPMIARWPGRIPPRLTSSVPAGLIDLMPTILGASGVALASGHEMDGENILPLMTGAGPIPERPLFSMRGARQGPPTLMTVRLGKWKLHVNPPRFIKRGPDYRDPWAPDGVTVIAPCEQPLTESHPGVTTGVAPSEMMLFDLATDPAEQKNVANDHPQVVLRLKAHFDRLNAEILAQQYD